MDYFKILDKTFDKFLFWNGKKGWNLKQTLEYKAKAKRYKNLHYKIGTYINNQEGVR